MAGKPMAMNQSCFAFRGLGVSQPAVYQIIKRAVRSLKAKANGATFAAINTRDLKIEEILVPLDEELTAFEEEAASLHSMMRVNEEESLKLSSLRDALLPKLMTGEIDVSELDLEQLNSHLAKSLRQLRRHASAHKNRGSSHSREPPRAPGYRVIRLTGITPLLTKNRSEQALAFGLLLSTGTLGRRCHLTWLLAASTAHDLV